MRFSTALFSSGARKQTSSFIIDARHSKSACSALSCLVRPAVVGRGRGVADAEAADVGLDFTILAGSPALREATPNALDAEERPGEQGTTS